MRTTTKSPDSDNRSKSGKVTSSAVDAKTMKELQRLQFRTRRLANEISSGAYRSAFRGLGIEFEEVREYTPGDDIRAIDWKVTARTGAPYIKRYREERELHIMVAVDLSASTLGGSKKSRASVIAQVGAVLTLVALHNNDKVGLMSFTDSVHSFSPPRKGRGAVWRVLHQVMQSQQNREGTDIANACSYLDRVLRRRTIVFIISDFISPDFEKEIVRLKKKHDVVGVIVEDESDITLPDHGLVRFQDPESGTIHLIDTSDSQTRAWFKEQSHLQRQRLETLFRKNAIDTLRLSTDKPFMPEIRRFLEGHGAARRVRQ